MKTSNLLLKGFVRESNGCCFVYRSVSHMKQLPFLLLLLVCLPVLFALVFVLNSVVLLREVCFG